MKHKILLCLAMLALAGCAFNEQAPRIDYGGWGVPDTVPMPARGMTPADVQQMYNIPGSVPALT
ncbi:MAG TPA: hypothetical protein VH619_19495 [Verrucomicrobiae bacterium]|nr:hypothetical protein [Verrucomicrobiae bacterium]